EETQVRSTTFLSYVVHMKKRDEERQEAARLMYVAFTRAKKFLTVVGEETNVSLSVFDSASVMQWILFAAEADEEIASRIVWAEEEERTETEGKPVERKTLSLERLEKKYAFSADAETPCKLTVSDVLKKTEETPGSKEVFFEKNVGGENAAAKGTATHAVMQYVRYDTKTKEELAEQMDEMVRKGFLTEEERAIAPADAIFEALQSDFIQSLVGKKLLREQPFVRFIESPWSNGNKTLLQGVIDLLVSEEDGLTVVDFKTGKANAETLKNRYKKQLELYADAAENILKKKMKKKIVFAIETLTVVEI
ncbi:MAG: PD-(D/E)XK nuclease family protein, partial [Clostridia bacterium]|nr:PD-(D/E)XK nuclease family protein [Clostridia bacterium]